MYISTSPEVLKLDWAPESPGVSLKAPTIKPVFDLVHLRKGPEAYISSKFPDGVGTYLY